MKRQFQIGETKHAIVLMRKKDGFHLSAGEGEDALPCALEPLGHGRYALAVNGARKIVHIAVAGDQTWVHIDGHACMVARVDPLDALAAAGGGQGGNVATAPMPGTVIAVAVKAGDAVVQGQTLMVIESMKLETAITAWRDGVVAEVHFTPGKTFPLKAPLVSLVPD